MVCRNDKFVYIPCCRSRGGEGGFGSSGMELCLVKMRFQEVDVGLRSQSH